jgi:hypothetical protein
MLYNLVMLERFNLVVRDDFPQACLAPHLACAK